MLIKDRKNIFILNNQPGFEEQVKADLQKIEENSIGKRLIEKIAAGAHPVFIKYSDRESECFNLAYSRDPKKGTNSLILYAPAEQVNVCTDQLQPLGMPNFITLFHEMVHAHHISRGKDAQTHDYDQLVWTDDEEYHTIMGFPSKKPHRQTPKITENAFRTAQGLPCRYGHFTSAALQDDPVLVSHIELEKVKTLAKAAFENKILHDSTPLPIRNVTIDFLIEFSKTQ